MNIRTPVVDVLLKCTITQIPPPLAPPLPPLPLSPPPLSPPPLPPLAAGSNVLQARWIQNTIKPFSVVRLSDAATTLIVTSRSSTIKVVAASLRRTTEKGLMVFWIHLACSTFDPAARGGSGGGDSGGGDRGSGGSGGAS